jgi:hypothetical protein
MCAERVFLGWQSNIQTADSGTTISIVSSYTYNRLIAGTVNGHLNERGQRKFWRRSIILYLTAILNSSLSWASKTIQSSWHGERLHWVVFGLITTLYWTWLGVRCFYSLHWTTKLSPLFIPLEADSSISYQSDTRRTSKFDLGSVYCIDSCMTLWLSQCLVYNSPISLMTGYELKSDDAIHIVIICQYPIWHCFEQISRNIVLGAIWCVNVPNHIIQKQNGIMTDLHEYSIILFHHPRMRTSSSVLILCLEIISLRNCCTQYKITLFKILDKPHNLQLFEKFIRD